MRPLARAVASKRAPRAAAWLRCHPPGLGSAITPPLGQTAPRVWSARLRLHRHRLRLRRRGLRLAAQREGLPRRGARDGQALAPRGLRDDELERAQVALDAEAALLWHPADLRPEARPRPARCGRRRRQPRVREHPARPARAHVRGSALARGRGLGATCSRRITPWRASCSARRSHARRSPPIGSCARRWRRRPGEGARSRATPSACTSETRRGGPIPDPYFGGEGPPRTGCTLCGGCMIGCRHGAKNTLDRNYLFLAERRGCVIHAETQGHRRPADGGRRVRGPHGPLHASTREATARAPRARGGARRRRARDRGPPPPLQGARQPPAR